MSTPIYLDYAATTPVDPDVARAMFDVLGETGDFGNPAAVTHDIGRRAGERVERARAQVAALIGAGPREIVFTSGATESNNLALLGAARAAREVPAPRGAARNTSAPANAPHIVTTKIEHKAVLDVCKQLEREGFSVTYLAPDASGRVPPQAVRDALRAETVLVSVMHVNNEIGVIQDIESIGAICRERNVLFHVDAAQSAGKLAIDVRSLPVDLLSLTAHKLYGPKGIGALYVREAVRARVRPILFGGGQERGLRPGTLPTHQIVGFGQACALASERREAEHARIQSLRDRLRQALSCIPGVHLNGADAPTVPEILNVSFEGVEGESLVTALTSLAVSTGAACNSATGDPSYVLRALGRNTVLAQSSLRFSLGRGTTEEHVDTAARLVRLHVGRLRALAPDGSGAVTELKADQAPAPERDPLGPEVRRHFTHLPGAGRLKPGPGVVQGTAGSPAHEAWVRFHLAIQGGRVKTALFQAWGCPHTLAVSAWLTGQLPGRSREDLVPGTPAAWQATLGVPVEKLGRLLVIEDALKSCLRHWN